MIAWIGRQRQNSTKAADNTIKDGIQASVEKNHNMAKDMTVLKQSEEIRTKTKDMIAYLQDVREKLIAGTGNIKGKNRLIRT